MIGKMFGYLTVISEHSKTRNGHIRYVCSCLCGNFTNVLGTHLRQKTTVSCGCKIPKGAERSQWKGIGEMSGDFWHGHVVRNAKGVKGRAPLEFTLTKEEAWLLFLKQNRKCSLTGILLKFPSRSTDTSWTASLDRIDSSKGYILSNVQWVHKDINMMKRIYTQEHFIHMCKLVASNFLLK